MATRKVLPTPLDIRAITALKGQVDNALKTGELTKLGASVINQATSRLLLKFKDDAGRTFQDREFTNYSVSTLAAIQAVMPGAVVDVDVTSSGLFGTKKLTSVRIRGVIEAESDQGYAGKSTQPSLDPDLALLSAFVNTLEDLTKRQIAAQTAPLHHPDTIQTAAQADRVAEKTRASGQTRTPTRAVGFKAPSGGRQSSTTSGSLKVPGAARVPAQPKRPR